MKVECKRRGALSWKRLTKEGLHVTPAKSIPKGNERKQKKGEEMIGQKVLLA